MARPHKEGLDYFPHDTDAANDEKVEALRALHGNDGYAVYFILLERIYRTGSFELSVSDAETRQILARKCAVTIEKFDQILASALKYGCFDHIAYQERGVLTSNGIKKRASVVVEKRIAMREKYREQAQSGNRISDAETSQETQAETQQRKEKKSIDTYTPPSSPDGGVSDSSKSTPYPVEFESFWNAYPRRIEKKAAFKAWTSTLKGRKGQSGDRPTPEVLKQCALHYAGYCATERTEQRYVKHPATFLGPTEPWRDWVQQQPRAAPAPNPVPINDPERERKRLELLARTKAG